MYADTVHFHVNSILPLQFGMARTAVGQPVTLERLLMDYSNPEVLTDIRCDGCDIDPITHRTGHRTVRVARMPGSMMCIHLGRFPQYTDNHTAKDTTNVHIPLQLPLSATWLEDAEALSDTDHVWVLTQVVMHAGQTIAAGHYVT